MKCKLKPKGDTKDNELVVVKTNSSLKLFLSPSLSLFLCVFFHLASSSFIGASLRGNCSTSSLLSDLEQWSAEQLIPTFSAIVGNVALLLSDTRLRVSDCLEGLVGRLSWRDRVCNGPHFFSGFLRAVGRVDSWTMIVIGAVFNT